MGKRSKSKSKHTKSKRKQPGNRNQSDRQVQETRATAKLKAKEQSQDKLKSKPKSSAAQRSWAYRIVLIGAVAAFVGFSLLPALGIVKGLRFRSTPATAQVPVEQLQREIDGYQLVLEREPENETALQGLTDDLLQLGRGQEAIPPVQQLVALHPERVGLGVELGRLQLQVGQMEEGVKTFKNLYESHPTRTDVLKALVEAELATGDTQGAIALLEAKLDRGDRWVDTSLLLATAYERGDRFEDAMAVYDRLLDSDPEDFRPAFEKALALSNASKEQRDFEEAQRLFALAEDLAPKGTGDRIRAIAKSYRAYAADVIELEEKALEKQALEQQGQDQPAEFSSES